ncbi:hypothetical protein [Thermovibrio sp.]
MRKGITLIITLILSLVALIAIASLFYLISSSTQISGSYKKYTNSEEVAKGISNYLFRLMDTGDFCKYTDCNSSNSAVNLGNFSQIDDFYVNATLLYRVLENPASPSTSPQIYAVEVKVVSKENPNDKTVVDFVYRIH